MANNNIRKQAEATYSEDMTARVNKEGDHHEVLLRGVNSPTNISLRNRHGAKGFENGATYTVTFTKHEANTTEGTPGE